MRKPSHTISAGTNAAPSTTPEPISIPIDETQKVSGLIARAAGAKVAYVLAHGAGAGMQHAFLEDMSQLLVARNISTLRYNFLYMERGSGRPDAPPVAHAAVRAAALQASSLLPDVALFAGGKSFGGRMTSQAQAESPLPGVRGLIFLGFPLHPPGRPSVDRAAHLFQIQIPMLFLQGDRDEFADLALLRSVTNKLGKRATLKLFESADHSFHVPARTGRKDAEVRAEIANLIKDWTCQVLS